MSYEKTSRLYVLRLKLGGEGGVYMQNSQKLTSTENSLKLIGFL